MQVHLSKSYIKRLEDFFENHPPQGFCIFLRKLVLEYIRKQIKTGFSLDFERHLWSLEDLFELLDMAEEEIECKRINKE